MSVFHIVSPTHSYKTMDFPHSLMMVGGGIHGRNLFSDEVGKGGQWRKFIDVSPLYHPLTVGRDKGENYQ